eukprot:jgi/Botrbrau1/15478/Bobra.43_2s0098.1
MLAPTHLWEAWRERGRNGGRCTFERVRCIVMMQPLLQEVLRRYEVPDSEALVEELQTWTGPGYCLLSLAIVKLLDKWSLLRLSYRITRTNTASRTCWPSSTTLFNPGRTLT